MVYDAGSSVVNKTFMGGHSWVLNEKMQRSWDQAVVPYEITAKRYRNWFGLMISLGHHLASKLLDVSKVRHALLITLRT